MLVCHLCGPKRGANHPWDEPFVGTYRAASVVFPGGVPAAGRGATCGGRPQALWRGAGGAADRDSPGRLRGEHCGGECAAWAWASVSVCFIGWLLGWWVGWVAWVAWKPWVAWLVGWSVGKSVGQQVGRSGLLWKQILNCFGENCSTGFFQDPGIFSCELATCWAQRFSRSMILKLCHRDGHKEAFSATYLKTAKRTAPGRLKEKQYAGPRSLSQSEIPHINRSPRSFRGTPTMPASRLEGRTSRRLFI